MLLDSVRNMLRWRVSPAKLVRLSEQSGPSPAPEAVLAEDDDPTWPSARIAVAEALWGEGFLFPGGGPEVLRLAKPLGLSAASSLLLIGAGAGGPPRAIAAAFGVWVTGYEANPRLLDLANERSRCAGLGRRAQVEPWDPRSPKFPRRYFHHGMAIDALRVTQPEPLLAAVAKALKPGGQLVLLDTVSDQPLDAGDPGAATWFRLEHRGAQVPTELAITEALARLAFDVRIVEDVSQRSMQDAVRGWQVAVGALATAPPTRRQLAIVVREAELWLARFRLMRQGRLRLVRWHAIAG